MRGLAIVFAVLACAACGSSTKSSTSDPVAAAAKQTAAKGGTYTIAIDFSKAIKNGGKYSGSGTFDASGNFTLDAKYKGMPVHAVAAANAADHTIVYLQSAAFTGQLPEDKSWVSADLTQLAGHSKALDAVESPGSDPTQVLAMLARDTTGTRKLGTGRYRVTVDLAKASAEPGVAGAEAKQLRRTAQTARIPVDVAIDGNGFVRAIDEHVRPNGAVSLRFPHLGAPRAIEAPAASDVFDVTDRLASS